MSRFQISNFKFQDVPGALMFSVTVHFVALLWLGVSYAPEAVPELGPMVMWLATVEQEPSSFAEAMADKSEDRGARPSTPSVEPKKAQKELSEAVSQPVIDEAVIKKVETQISVPTAVEEKQTPEMSLEPETVVEDVLKPDQEISQPAEQTTVAAERVSSERLGLITQNPKLQTQNPTNAMLAFVGDPASLGITMEEPLDGSFLKAEVVVFPEPSYPTLSRRRGEEGRVVVKVMVSAKGEVRRVELHTSSSYPRLDRAALAAVRFAEFSPALEYGRPVESERIVAYRFELEGK